MAAIALGVAAPACAQQTVYLDFSRTGGSDFVFTQADRDVLQSHIEADFALFDYTFTQTAPSSGEYSTIFFNDGSTLGFAEKIDFRNVDKSDFGRVQTSPEFDSFDQSMDPIGDFLRFTANISSRTVGHLAGLETLDALGPLGSGLDPDSGFNPDPQTIPNPFNPFDPRVVSSYQFSPVYLGPRAASETVNNLMDYRVEQLTDSMDNLTVQTVADPPKRDRDQYFGQRSAIKLAFNERGSVVDEVAGPKSTFSTAQAIELEDLFVPITATEGPLVRQTLEVGAVAVLGQLTSGIERDLYSFQGLQGDLINIEVQSDMFAASNGGDRYPNTIDATVAVYDQFENRVAYFGAPDGAFHDDELVGAAEVDAEDITSLDARLLDLVLPEDGEYYIEVRSFENFDSGNYELFVNRALAVEAAVGDFNLDGVVDAADYVVWRSQNGQNVTPFTGADSDGNGKVDRVDLTKWADNYGQTGTPVTPIAGSSATSAAVPEPTAVGLALMTLAGVAAGRRRAV